MRTLIFLIPLFPLLGSLVLGLGGRSLSAKGVVKIGVGSVGLAALLSMGFGLCFIVHPPESHAYTQQLWTWMDVAGFRPEIRFRLDALSLVMTLVVAFVSFLIHLYSVEFMTGDDGYSRFFAYLNLFVAAMLTLVLADDLLLLYLGWEGVGVCSYLLIGFWYRDPLNGRAARKAFVVTRIGDTAMAIGLFILFLRLGTLEIQPLLERAQANWASGSGLAVAAAALLLGGAVGKSAQLPLQTWLPDAMAGPTPVSALMHAATMVTAGVYLIARTRVLFDLAPIVQHSVAIIGAATLLIAAFSALAQTDIKRVLAYSTISQIGYMFLALGVGAWQAAIFHFMTHAFFKALLFLAAGAVILSIQHEHDIFKMGGLRKKLPWVFWTFLIGAASLSALPLVTAGFYSKDLILSEALSSPRGSGVLWLAGILGAFLTSLYSFRLVFLVFLGQPKSNPTRKPGRLILLPLVTLAVLSILSGFVNLPAFLGATHPSGDREPWPALIASLASLSGICVASFAYLLYPKSTNWLRSNVAGRALVPLFRSGWEFDRLYDFLFVRPYLVMARVNKDDAIDLFFRGIARAMLALNRLASRTQTGRVRWYAAAVAGGAALLIGLMEVL